MHLNNSINVLRVTIGTSGLCSGCEMQVPISVVPYAQGRPSLSSRSRVDKVGCFGSELEVLAAAGIAVEGSP
jgi:hypothetical protein